LLAADASAQRAVIALANATRITSHIKPSHRSAHLGRGSNRRYTLNDECLYKQDCAGFACNVKISIYEPRARRSSCIPNFSSKPSAKMVVFSA